jgi:hypothetical protein
VRRPGSTGGSTHWLKLYGMLIDPSGLPPETVKALAARLEAGQG